MSKKGDVVDVDVFFIGSHLMDHFGAHFNFNFNPTIFVFCASLDANLTTYRALRRLKLSTIYSYLSSFFKTLTF